MYENFKTDFALNLTCSQFTNEQIQTIMGALDKSMYNYDISEKQTGIMVYNSELPELAQKFLVTKKIEGYSDGTLYNYKRFLYNFFLEIKKRAEDIETDDILYYLYWYQHRNPEINVSDRSLGKVLDCLRSFFGWACDRHLLQFDPTKAIKPIKYEIKERQALTERELEIVRRACATPKEKAIVETLYCTGCRCQELATLKHTDIDWENRRVHIVGKGKKHRTGFLTVKTIFLLQDYLKTRTDDNEWLFVSDRKPYNRLHNAGIEKIIRNIAERAGLNKPVTPHVFRHTLATHLINKSCSLDTIQKVLGHSEIGTTMRYAKKDPMNTQREYQKYVV